MTHVAVVCRQKAFSETRAKIGLWSYDVPDLTWDFYPVEDGQVVDKNMLAREHDCIFWEDWCWPTWEGASSIPVYAWIVDSNTSARRRKNYVARARQADVVLVDQDQLKHFNDLGKPVFRWQYAVNEQVFAPMPKSVDVAYHVARTDGRAALQEYLLAWLRDHPTINATFGGNFTIAQYVARLGAARIVVHKRTHEQCRSHRYFDALAAGCCLLADRGWSVNEDGFRPGVHYLEWDTPTELVGQIEQLLDTGEWLRYANMGQAFVLSHHTWARRAAELVHIMERVGEHATR
jgi:hypothetical protein